MREQRIVGMTATLNCALCILQPFSFFVSLLLQVMNLTNHSSWKVPKNYSLLCICVFTLIGCLNKVKRLTVCGKQKITLLTL